MAKKLTIMLDEEVYDGLYQKVGPRRISRFIEDVVRPLVLSDSLDDAYSAMAADEEREQEANAWVEGLLPDVTDETR